jgi:aminoglycoside phosphotransferase family enzyme/predicted kinase
MNIMTELNLTTQQQLINALIPVLEKQFNKPVERIETHISTLLLVGEQAFKIKKPVNFVFLDFTELQQRRFYCEEELRLNRRLAPDIYEKVIAITNDIEQPRINGPGQVIEYMVQMKRFEQNELFNHRLENGMLNESHIIELARTIADFHQNIESAVKDTGVASVETVCQATAQNFDQLRNFMPSLGEVEQQQFTDLEKWNQQQSQQLQHLFQQRLENGFVRECHGDMHLGNITMYRDRVTIFDGIEFNPEFHWIDVMSEIAFITMDLKSAGQTGFSNLLLNEYLEQTGDYGGLQLLPYYQVYRAMVRAKVTALRLAQLQADDDEYRQLLASLRHYLVIACRYTKQETARLLITHGVSGTGKSYVSQQVLKSFPYIRIRSDIERIRLYPSPEQRYAPEATSKTYGHLHHLAAGILKSGYPVIIDATYLEHRYRKAASQVAHSSQFPFLIISLQFPVETLKRRITGRLNQGNDASEATIEVLQQQLGKMQPLTEDEQKHALVISTDNDILAVTSFLQQEENKHNIESRK